MIKTCNVCNKTFHSYPYGEYFELVYFNCNINGYVVQNIYCTECLMENASKETINRFTMSKISNDEFCSLCFKDFKNNYFRLSFYSYDLKKNSFQHKKICFCFHCANKNFILSETIIYECKLRIEEEEKQEFIQHEKNKEDAYKKFGIRTFPPNPIIPAIRKTINKFNIKRK